MGFFSSSLLARLGLTWMACNHINSIITSLLQLKGGRHAKWKFGYFVHILWLVYTLSSFQRLITTLSDDLFADLDKEDCTLSPRGLVLITVYEIILDLN